MRILHITSRYHPAVGGAETYTKEISERLVKRGHDVTVVTVLDRPEGGSEAILPADEFVGGVRVRRFSRPGRLHDVSAWLSGKPPLRQLLGSVARTETLNMWAASPHGLRPLKEIATFRPDVATVINWYDGWMAYQACLARRVRRFTLVGVPLFHTERAWAHSPVYRDILRRCDAVVAMTEHECDFIRGHAAVTEVHPCGVGVNPESFMDTTGQGIRRRYSIGDAPVVGYVGRMAGFKGVPTLIAAMREVWHADATVRLLLAGAGATNSGPQDEVSAALAALSNAERTRVIVMGEFPESEKGAIFDALDVFAMPSLAESFGIAYLEAWIRKKAVIGARIGSTSCVIADGIDGVLVSPGDHQDLAAAILRLLRDPAQREQMGRQGYTKAMSRFTWDKVTDKVEQVYQRRRSFQRPPVD